MLITLAALLMLDAGRSLYARVGYARPAEVWRPDQKIYADLTWLPGADLPANTPTGQRIYVQRCAVCHGPDGRGNGPAAPSMIPRPRDFTLGQFKYKSTPAGAAPSDADLTAVVTNGLHASAMPAWRDLLSPEDIRAVVDYLKTLSPGSRDPGQAPVAVPPRTTPDDASRARGQRLYAAQGCATCHGSDGRLMASLEDAKGYPVVARDLTAPWTFRGGSAPEQIWLRLTTGLAPSPMPSFADTMTPEERWDVVNYVLSLARVAPWETGGKLDGPGQTDDLLKRGRYLVHAEMCGLCHTQIDHTGIYRGDDYYLAGGMRVDAYPHGVFVSRNLTSDPETGLGRWTEAQIVDALRNGHAPDRTLNFWGMPWIFLHRLSEEDALAIARYLKTLPPVRNRIPPALHYGVVETIVAKLVRGLPAAPPVTLSYADGNFAQPDGSFPRVLPQQLLVGGQWLVLVIGIAAFVLATPHGQRFPRGLRSRLRVVGWILALQLCALVGAAVNALPALGVIPPERMADAATGSIPDPDPASLGSPEQVALVQRGRYLFTVASCAFCHGNTGGGGNKLSWTAFGSLWSRNISSDPRFGIGNWSDEDVMRAIRSGVTPDGRMLHWQGMIWDHASNWDEVDLRALVAYLRTLPPVPKEVPRAQPPQADDCSIYTFWLDDRRTRGCE